MLFWISGLESGLEKMGPIFTLVNIGQNNQSLSVLMFTSIKVNGLPSLQKEQVDSKQKKED